MKITYLHVSFFICKNILELFYKVYFQANKYLGICIFNNIISLYIKFKLLFLSGNKKQVKKKHYTKHNLFSNTKYRIVKKKNEKNVLIIIFFIDAS